MAYVDELEDRSEDRSKNKDMDHMVYFSALAKAVPSSSNSKEQGQTLDQVMLCLLVDVTLNNVVTIKTINLYIYNIVLCLNQLNKSIEVICYI